MLSWCMFCIHKLGSPLFTLPTVFFPVFSPSSTGISSSKLPSFDIIFLVDILYKTSYHLCFLPTVFFPVSSPPSTRISHFKLSSFKTIVMTYVYTTSAHLRFNTSNSLFRQFAVLIFTGISFNITQTFFFMSNFNWYTVLWFVK